MHRAVLPLAVVACWLLAGATEASAADPFRAIFFDDGQTILQTSAELTLFSLEPERVPLFSRGRGKSARENFHGYPVLASVKLTGETKDELLGRLYTAIAEPASPARCFVPRHGIRARSGDKQIDLVICFECQQLKSYVGGRQGGGLISPSAQPRFDAILTRVSYGIHDHRSRRPPGTLRDRSAEVHRAGAAGDRDELESVIDRVPLYSTRYPISSSGSAAGPLARSSTPRL